MGISTAVALFSAVALCVSMAGASYDDVTLKSSAWTLGTYAGTTYYWLGLRAFYYASPIFDDGSFGTGVFSWDSGCDDDGCSKCAQAGQTALTCCGIAFTCCVLIIITSLLRLRHNMTVLKGITVLAGLVGFFCLLIGMACWANQCVDHQLQGFDYKLGPGFDCAIAAFVVLFTVTLIHLLTPVDVAGAEPVPAAVPSSESNSL